MSGSNPNAASPGVRQLNKVPLAIACGAGVIVAAAVGYTYHLRASQQAASAAAEAEQEPKPANGQAVLANAPEWGHIETPRPVTKPATLMIVFGRIPQRADPIFSSSAD